MKKFLFVLISLAFVCQLQAQYTWETALPLTNGIWSANGSVESGVNNDIYYRFEIEGESYLDIEMDLLSMAGTGDYVDISFYRLKTDNTLESINASYGSSSTRIWGRDVDTDIKWRFLQRSDGTYFLRVTKAGTNAATFRVRYSWDGGMAYPNDPEPNNEYAKATEFHPGETVYGHVGFKNHDTGEQDYYDCYKFTVAKDCDARIQFNITPCPGSNGDNVRFDMDGWQIMNEDSTFRYTPIGGWRGDNDYGVFDTVKIMRYKGLSAGTYYFRIYPYVGYAYYNFKLDVDYYDVPNDTEPNDEYAKAVEFRPGETVYGHVGFYDQTQMKQDYYDCYKFTVERDCDAMFQINIQPKGEGDIRMDMDSWQIMDADSTFRYSPVGGWRGDNDYGVFDTIKRMRYKGLSAGTYYFRIYPYVGMGTYNFKLDVNYYDVPNDQEPNDDYMHAMQVTPDKLQYGHAGFYDQTQMKRDDYDCFKFTVDKDCDVLLDFHIQPKGEGDIRLDVDGLQYMKPDSSFAYYQSLWGEYGSVFDTIKHYYSRGVAPGTYYFRANPYVGLGTYNVVLHYEKPKYESDAEPNDTWANAIPLLEGDTAFGHIGYSGANDSIGYYTDTEDWYIVKLPTNGSFNVLSQCYPMDGHGNVLDGKLGLNFRLHLVEDGVLDDVGTLSGGSTWEVVDTMTYNWKTTLGAATYYLQVTRRGGFGQYKFVYETRPAPVADFDFVQHINNKGESEVCFINKTQGDVTKYYWKYDEKSWTYTYDANPTVVYSTPGVREVKLIAYGKEGNDTIVKLVEVTGLQRVENPKAGQGDVTLRFYAGGIQRGDAFILEKDSVEYEGIVLGELKKGCMEVRFHLKTAALGKYNAIIRHTNNSEMRLDNAFTLEPATEPEIYVDLLGLDRMLFNRWQNFTAVIGNKGNVDAYNQTLWLVTPDDENCHILLRNVSFIEPEGDTLAWVKDIPPYLIYDSLEAGGAPVRVYPLMFSVIPAGSEVTVYFRMASNKSEELRVFVTDPFDTESLLKDYDSYESCVRWAIAKYVAEKALGFVLDQIPGAGCAKDVIKNSYQSINSGMDGSLTAGSLAWSVATTAWSCAKDFVGPLKAYKMTCDIVDLIIDIADNYDADKACKKYKKKKTKTKKVRAVSSLDPNEISGPVGFGEDNFVRKQDFTYNIMFENKATATAPAQEVNVYDTLDKTKFDLTSIQFKSFSIGDVNYEVQQAGLAFVSELNWDTVLVRVSGQLDTATSVVSWNFITLDSKTRDLITDPDYGFLKPNKNAPEGEGSVTYTISLNSHVKDGDIITNQATIIFDANEPIKTNIYSNRIDENKPSSAITSIELEEGTENAYTLHFSSSDKGCGVYFYRLNVSTNGQDARLVSDYIVGDYYTMQMSGDTVYRFYLQAVDSLYNEETPKSTPDYVFSPTGIPSYDEDADHSLMLTLRPNPTQRVANIDYRNSQSGVVRIEIFNMMGVRVYAEELGFTDSGIHTHPVNVSSFSKGVYAVRLQCGNDVRQSKLVVQ